MLGETLCFSSDWWCCGLVLLEVCNVIIKCIGDTCSLIIIDWELNMWLHTRNSMFSFESASWWIKLMAMIMMMTTMTMIWRWRCGWWCQQWQWCIFSIIYVYTFCLFIFSSLSQVPFFLTNTLCNYNNNNNSNNTIMSSVDFLAETNACGQTVLKLVSRGNAILAELLRLSDFIPPVFHMATKEERELYHYILPDFSYFAKQDYYDMAVNNNPVSCVWLPAMCHCCHVVSCHVTCLCCYVMS